MGWIRSHINEDACETLVCSFVTVTSRLDYDLAKLYNRIHYIGVNQYSIGAPHPALSSVTTSTRDVSRLPVKLKLLTGTYQLQSTRAAFNQNQVDPTCQLCNLESQKH
ncbi:Hypothetical predicted protein [Mytilus galloprovincialis]|uniref:Uncharacterized protein n=1 Tax=Mytilus galloprovincialis TaxID=29158 RepID=A0A8B6E0Z4_MYTGA|nr:Hypothetical predicted protein [Mytilus galloprovincialis]